MDDLILATKFRELKDKFNRYRGLTELTRDLEALIGDMTGEEKAFLISVLNEEDVPKTKIFKQKLIVRIMNDKTTKKRKKK